MTAYDLLAWMFTVFGILDLVLFVTSWNVVFLMATGVAWVSAYAWEQVGALSARLAKLERRD